MDRVHYFNGSITACDNLSCSYEHYTLEQAIRELQNDVIQVVYSRQRPFNGGA